ncbi:unnamed protein product [Caenorhabditis nigoni]
MAAMRRHDEVLEIANQERDRRIARLQTDARLNQAVIDDDRDADAIDFFDKERKAYEASLYGVPGANTAGKTGTPPPPPFSIADMLYADHALTGSSFHRPVRIRTMCFTAQCAAQSRHHCNTSIFE